MRKPLIKPTVTELIRQRFSKNGFIDTMVFTFIFIVLSGVSL